MNTGSTPCRRGCPQHGYRSAESEVREITTGSTPSAPALLATRFENLAPARIRWTFDEWRTEGVKRFGPEEMAWRFVCPACGHVQTAGDFRPYKAQGATGETVRFNCIGRYLGHRREAFGSGPGPCNYTSGGLFDLRPWVVAVPGGEVRTFAFAEPNKDASHG